MPQPPRTVIATHDRQSPIALASTTMKWLFLVGAAVVAVSLLVVGIGLILPRSHTATRTVDVPTPPDQVWAVITDVAAYPRWRPDVTRIEALPAIDGRPSWREITRRDSIPYETVESVPPRRFVTRIADRALPFGGQWSIDLAPLPQGTRVTITERGEIYNPVFRVFAHFVFGYTATMDAYLHALQRRLETPIAPNASTPAAPAPSPHDGPPATS
jgi:uncharacterized protein YndB with AHSA1/START domain